MTALRDARAQKISLTMRARKLDNFKQWRDEQKRKGIIKTTYPSLAKNGDLAELIGCILGDGHIHKHERCDSLRITSNSNAGGFIARYAFLIEKVFGKKPAIAKVKIKNATILTIYEKHISKRLGIPHGSRANLDYKLPAWIRQKREYRVRFLRGLYEAEGSECHHLPTSTHKLFFANRNPHLLALVRDLLRELGFTVSVGWDRVQVSRQKEVQNLANLLEFRHYER